MASKDKTTTPDEDYDTLPPEILDRLDEAHDILADEGPEAALEHFRKCAEEFPESLEVRFWLGSAHFMLDQYEEAIVEFKEILSKDPDNHPAREMLGRAYSRDPEMLEEAQELLEDVVGEAPERDEARFDLARIYAQQEDYESCFVHFSFLFAMEFKYAEFHSEFGLILEDIGQESHAVEHYERAVQIDPGIEPATGRLQALRRKKSSRRPKGKKRRR
ncbi:tetratricopeptide repeat protein [Thermodesulfobacteriota bacterium]